MQKIYIVIYKNKVQSFYNWQDCNEFIKEKENIKFKGFYLEDTENIKKFIDSNIKKQIIPNQPGVLYAYLSSIKDFSMDVSAWASVLIKDGDIESEESGIEGDEIYEEYQLVGETAAAVASILFALENDENRIVLIYNFIGIEMWANGSWKPKKDEYKMYVKFIKSVKGKIKIDFIDKEDIEDSEYYKRSQKLAGMSLTKGMKK